MSNQKAIDVLEKAIKTLRDDLRPLGITNEESINHCIFFFFFRMMDRQFLQDCDIDPQLSFNDIISIYEKDKKKTGVIEVYGRIFGDDDSLIRQIKEKIGLRFNYIKHCKSINTESLIIPNIRNNILKIYREKMKSEELETYRVPDLVNICFYNLSILIRKRFKER